MPAYFLLASFCSTTCAVPVLPATVANSVREPQPVPPGSEVTPIRALRISSSTLGLKRNRAFFSGGNSFTEPVTRFLVLFNSLGV
ncbi:MAG: hypothetical protein A2X57_03585 [Nitrospirae bacterium GWD2_57_8]|nr:MAG: hypothetical protein A2X57_03585 [Nitrospirae bacterium GWD2_57_8]